MKRSEKDDERIRETRAVLLRLQRFTDDPDKVEFQDAASDAPVRPRRVGLVIAAVAAVALIAAGAYALFDLDRPPATPDVASVPKAVAPEKIVIQDMPVTGAAMAPSAPKITVEERTRAEQFLAGGEAYLADGNVIGARDFFERAADIGLAAGALRLAETYDPGALQRLQAHGVVPDVERARRWYQRAHDLGATEAAERLVALGAR